MQIPREQFELAAQRVPLIAARLAYRLPPGMNQDDLESAGNLAITKAIESFDPALGFEFLNYAARAARNAMVNEISRCRQRNRKRVPLEIQADDDGRALVRPDPKAANPADVAEVREMVRVNGKRRSLVLTQVRASSPEVAAVAARAQELRQAAFEAVSGNDMADVMKTLVANAKRGHVGSARLLLDYVGGNGRGQAASVQQAIIVPAPDADDIS